MECPKCGCTDKVMNGLIKGVQRYRCNECGCNYTRSYIGKVSDDKKRDALRLYTLGLSFRKIAWFLGVSNVAVLNWVKRHGEIALKDFHAKLSEAQEVSEIEIDEMWHYIKKKSKSAGSGFVLIELPKSQSPSSLGTVTRIVAKDF